MNPTTFHCDLTSREMGLVQDALNAVIRDCGERIETAIKTNNSTALAYYTRRRVQADMLYDKLHAAPVTPAAAALGQPHQVA